jgi:hypothetical protein
VSGGRRLVLGTQHVVGIGWHVTALKQFFFYSALDSRGTFGIPRWENSSCNAVRAETEKLYKMCTVDLGLYSSLTRYVWLPILFDTLTQLEVKPHQKIQKQWQNAGYIQKDLGVFPSLSLCRRWQRKRSIKNHQGKKPGVCQPVLPWGPKLFPFHSNTCKPTPFMHAAFFWISLRRDKRGEKSRHRKERRGKAPTRWKQCRPIMPGWYESHEKTPCRWTEDM